MIIREAKVEDAAGIARVQVDSWRTTYTGILPDEELSYMSYEISESRWRTFIFRGTEPRNKAYYIVAENEAGEIVGFVSGGRRKDYDPEFQSELFAIYILQEYQRQGIGRRLTEALVKKLIQAEMTSMIVWVLAENSSRHFYETLGGQPVRKYQQGFSGKLLDVIGYGWTDISALFPPVS